MLNLKIELTKYYSSLNIWISKKKKVKKVKKKKKVCDWYY